MADTEDSLHAKTAKGLKVNIAKMKGYHKIDRIEDKGKWPCSVCESLFCPAEAC